MRRSMPVALGQQLACLHCSFYVICEWLKLLHIKLVCSHFPDTDVLMEDKPYDVKVVLIGTEKFLLGCHPCNLVPNR